MLLWRDVSLQSENIIFNTISIKSFSWLSKIRVFSGLRVTRSLVLCICFVDRCLSFCTVSFGHCVVFFFSIYGLWLPLWYLQTLFSGVRVSWSLVLCVYFVDRCLFFFFWPLCCLSFDLRIRITPLVYSNSSRCKIKLPECTLHDVYDQFSHRYGKKTKL